MADEKNANADEQLAPSKAIATWKMANTLAKALARRFGGRWQFIDFLGPNGRESAGVVDIVAIRKCGKPPTLIGLKRLDLFDIQLIQVKGGGTRPPTPDDIARLRLVKKHYRATKVILYEWTKEKRSRWLVLNGSKWGIASPAELFGSKS